MFNPFEKLTVPLIEAFRKKRERYLVSQTYTRGLDPFQEEGKTALLFSKYDDRSKADIHMSAIKGDKYAAIVDLENENHRNIVTEMIRPDSKYIVFTNVIRNVEEAEARMNRKYKQNMKRYITKTTNWMIPGGTILIANLEVSYGELFITMKFKNQRIRPKLEDVEKS